MRYYYTTKTEAVAREILEALGEYATEHDVEGLADRLLAYDEVRGYYMSATAGDFDEVLGDYALLLEVDWISGSTEDEMNGLWRVWSVGGGELAGGYFEATEDHEETDRNLVEAVEGAGFKRGDTINAEGDWATFTVERIN